MTWGFSVAVPSTVWSFFIVVFDPLIKVALQLFDRLVESFSEGDLVELLQDRLVKAFTDSVGLRALGFRLRMIDVLDGKIELVLVMIPLSTVLGSAIGEHAKQRNALLVEEGHDAIVEYVRSGQRVLSIVEFREGDSGILGVCR